MPSRAICDGRRWVMSLSPSQITPLSGRKNPLIKLSSEVLPAPLGPITETISPRSTPNVTSSMAHTPPKCFDTASTESSDAAKPLPARLGRECILLGPMRRSTISYDECAGGRAQSPTLLVSTGPDLFIRPGHLRHFRCRIRLVVGDSELFWPSLGLVPNPSIKRRRISGGSRTGRPLPG